MVYQQAQGHSRAIVPAKDCRRFVSRWSPRLLAVAILWAGLTTMAGSVGAQPSVDPLMKERPPRLAPSVAEVPAAPLADAPSGTPLALQDEKQLPPGDKLPKGAADELPNPKAIPPFGPEKVRMPRLHEPPSVMGTTPRPTAETLKKFNAVIEGVIDPEHTFDVVESRTRIILLKETPTKIQVADDSIIGHNLLEPKQMIVVGRRAGTTVMTMWFPDPKDKTKEIILSYLVRVIPDPELKYRLEQIYKALEKEIQREFPDSMIRLNLVGDKVVVSGQAKDIQQATMILRIIRGNLPNDTARLPINNINLNVQPSDLLNPQGTAALENFITAGGPNIINMIRIPGEQQVMLRVTVAEVSRSAARSIGLNFNIINNKGTEVFGQQTGALIVGGSVLNGNFQNTQGGVLANLPVILDNGQIPIAISALKTLNYARSLAEPNLTALNGQTASFQAGGSFPVPVIGGFGGGGGGSTSPGLQGVQFIPYGVSVNFTPFITDRDRIRLDVRATVSTRDISTGTQVANSQVSGLSSRNFNSTVEMREGQTMAVAGLIQTNIGAQTNRVPFFGDIPILNRFMGYDKLQGGEQELVILITPELVHPLEKKEVTKVPGSDLFEPSDLDFFLCGKLENRRSMDYRSQAMNDLHRMTRYKHAEQTYIFGPVGHMDDPNYPFDPYDRYGREIRPSVPPAQPRPETRTQP